MNIAMEKTSSNRDFTSSHDMSTAPSVHHQVQHGKNEAKQSNRDIAIHENDDIIIAQQVSQTLYEALSFNVIHQ